jgi:hypothetical protein
VLSEKEQCEALSEKRLQPAPSFLPQSASQLSSCQVSQ